MAKLSLQLKIGQSLTMTPQLQQAIRLLQLPVLDLNAQLEEALESNLMLEQEESPADDAPQNETTQESEVVAGEELERGDWEDIYGSGRKGDSAPAGQLPQIDLPDTSGQSLHEHLLWQLQMDDFSPREAAIGETIVDYINDDGYLTESLDSILNSMLADTGVSLEELEGTLQKLQQLDPAGIGGRDPAECISIQLRQLDPSEPALNLAVQIAENDLSLVADRDYATLRRKLGASDADIDTAIALIKSCHPRPGSIIQPNTAQYVIPDVYVRKQDGRWIVDVNRGGSPQLKVNQAYADLLRGHGEHTTLRTQLQEARWLIRSLEIRHETLLKVAMSIVERQMDFLEHGEEAMKPMILKDIAEMLEMHESTISRVTTNKFMHTPRGVFEFRYFFSSQLQSNDGDAQSSTAIRARIKRLIGKENLAKPLSDSKISKLLGDEGIQVARRTVAKYREAMNIAPSNERRERPAHN
jgi:RNA polymerase sigma-54 factor